MFKLTVVYRTLAADERFDEEHYHTVQLADALSFLGKYGCQKIELAKAVTNVPERNEVSWPETIYRTMEIWFDTLENLRAAVYSPEMLALDERFRDPSLYKRRAETFVGEVERYEFGPDGTVVSAAGPWAGYFTDRLGLSGGN